MADHSKLKVPSNIFILLREHFGQFKGILTYMKRRRYCNLIERVEFLYKLCNMHTKDCFHCVRDRVAV